MRPQACLQLLNPLLFFQPSFISKEAKILGVTASVLGYYVKAGKLKRIFRGVYQAIGYQNAEVFRWVDLIKVSLLENACVRVSKEFKKRRNINFDCDQRVMRTVVNARAR